MMKIYKIFAAFALTISLGVATVVCCCSASAAMADFQEKAMCDHCPATSSHDNSSKTTGTCQYQLSSAEFSHSQIVSTPNILVTPHHSPIFLNNHQITLTHSLLLAYPPGGPPLGISFIPPYLRTFHLRI